MSAKPSNQPGRRTPLSLSGAVTKGQPNKGVNASNGSGNANGHTSNNHKQDNKLQQQQKTEQQAVINSADTKDNPNKKQTEKKQQQQQNDNKKSGSEKTQNGVDNKQQVIENKEKQQQNGKDEKLNDKDKKEKSEKQDKPEKQDKSEKQDKYEKEETKKKDDTKDQEKSETKKEDKKVKEVKDDKKVKEVKEDKKVKEVKEEKKVKEVKEDKKVKEVQEDKKEAENRNNENKEKDTQSEKAIEEMKTMDQTEDKTTESNPEHNDEGQMEVVEEQQQQQQKSPPVTPKANTRGSKTSTPSNKTPTKASEKTPQKTVTPSSNSAKTPSNSAKTTPVVTREVTTAIDADVDMEPLAVEHSPIKSTQLVEATPINITPSATSTPGKIVLPKHNTYAPKSDVQLAMKTGLSPERPRVFSQISGRKSIRPITEYTPSKFHSNSQFRESYRRINTELDATNTSLNVTVGSEVPNNSSLSLFFGRGRKRDRTPPQHSRSAIGEIQTDMEISPPKRAKYDMHGFLSAVSSPLSLLRNRFSRATLQSSTPVKLEEKLNSAEDEIEVQNVSGVSVHEEINKTDKDSENTATNNEDDATLGIEAEQTQVKKDEGTENTATKQSEVELKDISLKYEKTCGMEYTSEQSETPIQPAVGDPMTKNKRCVVM